MTEIKVIKLKNCTVRLNVHTENRGRPRRCTASGRSVAFAIRRHERGKMRTDFFSRHRPRRQSELAVGTVIDRFVRMRYYYSSFRICSLSRAIAFASNDSRTTRHTFFILNLLKTEIGANSSNRRDRCGESLALVRCLACYQITT